jgi:hypothetical protein
MQTHVVHLPFQIDLPPQLPSTFLYAGSDLSWLSVDYWLGFKFIGLTATQFGVPNAQVL